MSSFRTQHPIAQAFDSSAMSVARVAPAGEIASSGLAGLSSIVPTTIHKDSAMRHSHTSRGLRTSAKALLAIVGLGFAGACADSFNAPTSEVSAKAPAGYNKKDGVTTFQYIPKQGATKRFGDHMIVIAANGVCDPATSGYGAMATDNWNAPCTAVNHPIVFTATSWTDADGHPYVEFQPAVRFVPDKETYLYLRDGKRTAPTDLTIRYCPTVDNCIDESVNDPSLATCS